jgi:branched-subunit amino acid ABC-type transport system permease component
VLFFASLLVNGILAGAVYALIALSFVVVYKSSRMINFAVGEWVMFGSLLVATGLHVFAMGLTLAIILACAGMVGLACVFGRLVLRHMIGRPLASMIMITLGLGALMRGVGSLVSAGPGGGTSSTAIRASHPVRSDCPARQAGRRGHRIPVHCRSELVLPREPSRNCITGTFG